MTWSGCHDGSHDRALVEGTGVGVVAAGTAADRDKAATPGWTPEPGTDWSHLRPGLVTLPDGKTVVDTAFSRLTGRSPVLLAGMTPTTVDPEIVAAAANAGFWAEMAGGGQVTEEVYNENLAGLRAQLRPGHTAEFNSMFLDRYLWNLQFGQARIVSRSRASGAPIDGVVVSAGIPEKDEALALIEQLRADGFPYVAFKPGTVDQIRKVIAIGREADPIKVIVQVEDGHSGGPPLLGGPLRPFAATYAQLRASQHRPDRGRRHHGTPGMPLTSSPATGRPALRSPADARRRRSRWHRRDDDERSAHHQSRQGTPRRHPRRARRRRVGRLGRRKRERPRR